MTRFARKGKAQGSAQREPEEATPWSQMVASIKPRNFNVEDDDEYLGGKDNSYPESSEEESDVEDVAEVQEGGDSDKDMEEVLRAQVKDESEDEEMSDEENGALVRIISHEDLEEDESGDSSDNDKSDVDTSANLKRKFDDDTEASEEQPAKKKKKKPAIKCKICKSKDHLKRECDQLSEERRKELQDLYTMKVERKGKGTGRKKKNKNKHKLPYESNNNKENDTNDFSSATTDSPNRKKNKNRNNRNNKFQREVRDRSGAVVEAGEAIFHGFRVMKEDKVKLTALYKELKDKGLNKAELEAAIKRERRIAEKRLDRSKKLVCFKCRQPGHMLADCPMATDSEKSRNAPDSGICFKCGSLEHKAKDCRSKARGENAYNFAVCFICKDKGHLAKACPDNPKGLYPRGGGCKLCGSVEHLKKDCPRRIERGVTAATIGDSIEDEPTTVIVNNRKKFKEVKREKVVKF